MKGNHMDHEPKPAITAFGEKLLDATQETGEITLEGKTYTYRVCDPTMQPNLKYFVGFGAHTGAGKELFISSDVPPEFRKYVFLHEVNCVPHIGESHHCSSAEKHVFEHVPRPDVADFADLRKQMFTNLIAYLNALPKRPEALISEMCETLEFLETK